MWGGELDGGAEASSTIKVDLGQLHQVHLTHTNITGKTK
jgi:hypothetical protein